MLARVRYRALAALVALAALYPCVAQCPDVSWTLYDDTAGTPPYQEGHNSCVLGVEGTFTYADATTQCAALDASAHLLTIGSLQAVASSSLFATVAALSTTGTFRPCVCDFFSTVRYGVAHFWCRSQRSRRCVRCDRQPARTS